MGRTVPATVCVLAALSIEFVCKPQEVYRLRTAIPAAIEGALGQVPGFAGCMLLVSDKEPRLATVITFWEGEERMALSGNSAPRIHKLLAPFLDHCLQVRSHDAYLPVRALASQATLERTARLEDFSICVA